MKDHERLAQPALRDVLAPGLRVLFVGINPGIRTAQTGHHFAGHSNRFWKLLHESGLTPERLSHVDDRRLPCFGYGITNLVSRATPGIGDLSPEDYRAGRQRLVRKVGRWRPGVVALVGVTLYRALLRPSGARIETGRSAGLPFPLGLREETLARVPVFVLPNPSGRNANYSYAVMLEAFTSLDAYLRLGPRLQS